MSYDPRNIAKPVSDVLQQKHHKIKYNVNYTSEDLKLCLTVFRRLPWLKDTIEEIFVNPVNLPENFYDKNNYTIENDVKFFKVNLNYYIMRCNGKTVEIDDDDIITVDYQNNLLKFQVGIKTLTKIFVVQNKEMFKDEESYLQKLKNTDINISDIKSGKITPELIETGRILLLDYVNDLDYINLILKSIIKDSKSAEDFAIQISKIILGGKYGNIFSKRLTQKYYNPEIINTLDYNILLEGVDLSRTDAEDFVEDTVTNIILFSAKYYDVPERKYFTREKQIKPLKFNKLDVRLKCYNIDDSKNIPEENITFYTINNEFYCFDIRKLYYDFKQGNFINPYTKDVFDEDFVNKITSIYNFKINSAPKSLHDSMSSEDYDAVVNEFERLRIEKDEEFQKALTLIRKLVEDFNLDNDSCVMCKKKFSDIGISTLNPTGEQIHFCSKYCFEKY